LMAIFKASPDPLIVYDTFDQVRYLNDAFTKVFGWQLHELKGAEFSFVPEGEQQISGDLFLKKNHTNINKTIRFETKRYTRSGDIVNIYSKYSTECHLDKRVW